MLEFFSKIDIGKILRYALYMLLVLIFQTMLLSQIRIFGVCCMFLPAAVTAVAMFESPVFGAVFALILGAFADMAFIENTITFALVFPILSFAVSFISRFFINKQFMSYMIVALGSLLAVAAIQMIMTLVSDSWSISMLSTMLLQVVLSLPAAAAVYFWPAKNK